MTKKFTTIEQMEAASKNEDDGAVYKQIRGEWLEVMTDGKVFTYRWGKNSVTRDVAINILTTA